MASTVRQGSSAGDWGTKPICLWRRASVGANLGVAQSRIETRLDAALRQVYGRRTFDAALSKDRAAMMREIRDQVRAEADALGIEVVDHLILGAGRWVSLREKGMF